MQKNIDIRDIQEAIITKRIRISDHADDEAKTDDLTYDEILYAVLHGEIIECYPDDKPYPSCLILGETFVGDPIHCVWAFNNANNWAVLITVYRPNPELWINWRERRK